MIVVEFNALCSACLKHSHDSTEMCFDDHYGTVYHQSFSHIDNFLIKIYILNIIFHIFK